MSHPSKPAEAVAVSLSNLPEEARSRALARFQIIRPFLEDGVPLAQLAREQGIVLRTARRWVDRYRREGLTGLARKERGDKDKRKLTPALQQLIEGLALRRPSLDFHGRDFGPSADARLHGNPLFQRVFLDWLLAVSMT